MPVMDGLSATHAIRRHETQTGLARTPIVGLTANAMVEDRERCLAAGMDAHVAKPVEWASLFATLDRMLGLTDRPSTHASNVTRFADVLELRKLEELAGLLGRNRLTGMLMTFVEELPSRLALAGSGGTQALSEQMHMLVGTSGELGFHELSALCAEIVREARRGAGLDRLAELRSAGDRAIAAASRSGFAKVA